MTEVYSLLEQIIILACFTLIIHLVETLTYAIRIAGVRLSKLAVALSLVGVILLISRTANLFQGVLSGSIIDHAKSHPDFSLVETFHIIIGSATAGTLLALLLYPTVVALSSRMIDHLELAGSIPQMVRSSVSIDKLQKARKHLRLPKLSMLSRLRVGGIPKRLILMNCFVTAIYTIGVLAALLASTLTTEDAMTAAQSSGLINGIATILLTILIDPQVGILTDKVLRGERKPAALQKMFVFLMMSRLAGTLLAQVLLVPAAYWIKWVVSLV